MYKKNHSNTVLSAIIIGSGFGGIGMAIQLDQAGISDFLIIEKANDVGGTWRDNDYPGSGCDVPSHLYSYSFEPRTDWPHKYARQPDIHAYIKHCVSKYGLRSRLRLGCEIKSARFDEGQGLWCLTSIDGEELRCRALITACGQLNRPVMPELDGLEDFAGPAFHSARWQHDVDLSGKRVAVIGTGASAIQFVPQIVPLVASMLLFQRSAPYVLPKDDRQYNDKKRAPLTLCLAASARPRLAVLHPRSPCSGVCLLPGTGETGGKIGPQAHAQTHQRPAQTVGTYA